MNVVVFANDYEELVNWYKDAFGLEVITKEEGTYTYTELGSDSQVIVGITPASEVEHTASSPRNNSVVMQVAVSDITTLFKSMKKMNGKILFGPSSDEKYTFKYGVIADIEGNQIWVIESQ